MNRASALRIKTKHRGRSCVAGGPGGVSCTNTQYIQGISLHVLPSAEKDNKKKAGVDQICQKTLTELCAICFVGIVFGAL